jgi:hypothetical protein
VTGHSNITGGNEPSTQTVASGRRMIGVMLGVIAVALAALVVMLLADDGDGGDTATPVSIAAPSSVAPSSPSSAAPTTTAVTQTTAEATTSVAGTSVASTSVASTSVASTRLPPVDDQAAAVWPWVDSDVRYADPVDAARGFALEFIGFTDPIIGAFVQGDARSGEVEVRSIETFTPTVVFVRQLGTDGTWWVIGSATENVVVDEPRVGDQIASPLTVSGRSSASEGTVYVEIRADGAADAIFSGFVTGGGSIDGLGPFSEVFQWPDPGVGSGAIVFQTTSSDDGRIFEAGVIRVHFGRA